MSPIAQIVETALYADDLDAAEAFYRDVLGLERIGREAGRHVFFSVGRGDVLLVFRPAATLHPDPEGAPAHGATGPGHAAFGIAAEDLDAWRDRLAAHGVAVEREITWPRGGRSLYFRDPAGNSLELLTRGLWGTPEGW
jgi:catechol 2,3-dioxygenase-like lactoylglutathione lyase family enzyme